MLKRISSFLSIIFAFIWSFVLLVEYWHYNPFYGQALSFFQYQDLLLLLLLLGAGISWGLKNLNRKLALNGLAILGIFIFLDVLTMSFCYGKIASISLNGAGLLMHVGNFLLVTLCVYLIYLVCRVLGIALSTVFPFKVAQVDLPIIQTAFGVLLLTFVLFFLGVFHLLYPFVVAPLLIFVLLFHWKLTVKIIKTTLLQPIPLPGKLNTLGVFSFLFLSLFLVWNFAQLLRPFPMGTDSINLYVNLPSLINDYAGLVDGHQPYNWSLFMSLGLLAFGRVDVVLALSFFGGLMALFALFRLSRKWLDVNYALLCLLLFFSVPMINFLSYMDMKIDMGLLFILLCILILFVNWLSPPSIRKIEKIKKAKVVPLKNKKKGSKFRQSTTVPKKKKEVLPNYLLSLKSFFAQRMPTIFIQHRLLVLMGLLSGFALGIKLTALLIFFALLTALWYAEGGFLAFLSAVSLSFGGAFLLRLDERAMLRGLHEHVGLLQWLLLVFGIALLFYIGKNRKELVLRLMKMSLVLTAFFLLPMIPWLGKNLLETKKVSVGSLLNGKKSTPEMDVKKMGERTKGDSKKVVIPGLYGMPDVSPSQLDKKVDSNGAVREDLHKFMGYEIIPTRYLSIPFDTALKTNQTAFFADVGFLLIILVPILFLFPRKDDSALSEKDKLISRTSLIGLASLLLVISISGAFINRQNISSPQEGLALLASDQNTSFIEKTTKLIHQIALQSYSPVHRFFTSFSSQKDTITYPILMLLLVLSLFIVNVRIRNQDRVTKTLIFFLMIVFFLWWILGSGAAWYGIILFAIPYIFLLKGISPKDEEASVFTLKNLKSNLLLATCFIWLALAFVFRSTNYNPVSKDRAAHLYIPTIMEYQNGKIDENTLMDMHYPAMRNATSIINKEDHSLVYRIGTQANYFINKNDSRVYNDTFLDFFNSLVRRFKDKRKIIEALKERGFSYIIFDLSMSANDRTPDKSLTRKFTQFMNTLYDNPGLELVMTDRTIKLNATGEVVNAVFENEGSILNSGQVALFRIK